MSRTPIVVVGAGLQGLCSALALVERGEPVRLIERREGPALETSYANAGMLTPSQPDPDPAATRPDGYPRLVFVG